MMRKEEPDAWDGHCHRCGKRTNCHAISFLNIDWCCMSCLEAEKKHPKYKQAKEEELRQVKAGNFNFNPNY